MGESPALIRRGVRLDGKRTSTKLEPEFWDYLDAVARWRNLPVNHVVECILHEAGRRGSMASVLRVYCLEHARRHAAQMHPPSPGISVEWVAA